MTAHLPEANIIFQPHCVMPGEIMKTFFLLRMTASAEFTLINYRTSIANLMSWFLNLPLASGYTAGKTKINLIVAYTYGSYIGRGFAILSTNSYFCIIHCFCLHTFLWYLQLNASCLKERTEGLQG